MRTVHQVATLVTELATKYAPVKEIQELPEIQSRESVIALHITLFLDEVLKTIANIDQTSLNKMDRAQRLIELEANYGIPKTHTILNHNFK